MKKESPSPATQQDTTEQQEAGRRGPSGLQGAGGGGNQMVARMLDGGGLEDAPDGFVEEMEAAFGVSFQGVKVRADSDDGTEPDAVATTRGPEVHLATGFRGLPRDAQEHILAHELAHVAQQRGEGDQGASAVEGDADRAADEALQRGEARPEATAGPGPHDFGWDDVQRVAGAAATGGPAAAFGTAAAIGLSEIGSARELLAHVSTVGLDVARPVIDAVIEHKTDIALSMLSLCPGTGVWVYILRNLPEEEIQRLLESIPPERAAMIVAQAVMNAAGGMVLGPLFNMGAGITILKHLTPPVLVIVWQHAPQETRDAVKDGLVDLWEPGLGLVLDGSIGATFGYPVYLGGEAYFEVAHMRPGEFVLRRGGVMTEALDSGVGVGAFVGVGGDKDGEGGVGVGAEAGAQAQGGLEQLVHQEFVFPVLDDAAFLSFAITAASADTSTPMQALGHLSSRFRAVDPAGYNTKTKFEIKAFAEGNAMASAGVRTGTEDTKEGVQRWDNRSGKADTGKRSKQKWWHRWAKADVFGRIAAEAGVGIELENQEFTKDEDGVRVPSKMKVEAAGEGSAALSLAHSIPIVSQALPPGIDFEAGGGIKVSWILSGAPGDKDPSISEPTYTLFTKTGGMTRYDGKASEFSVGITSPSEEMFESLDTFLSNIQAETEFKRRFSVGHTFGRKYVRAADRQGAFNTMLPAEYRSYGFRLEGYLDLGVKLTADQVRSIFRGIARTAEVYQEGGEPLQQLYMDVMRFFSTGEAPAHVAREVEAMADVVLSSIDKLHLHTLVGLSAAAGGKLSAGAKVRLQGRVGGQITTDLDLLQYVEGEITTADIRALLRGDVEAKEGSLELGGDRA